jgi:ubiquitin-like-conjugating enzyme ATG3
LRRAADLERAAVAGGASALDPRSEFALSGEDEGWTATHRDPAAGGGAAAAAGAASGAAAATGSQASQASKASQAADDGVPDLGDLDLADAAADEATVSAASGAPTTAAATTTASTITRTRTYDLHVTYDQYYRVPRFWLVGFDEQGRPLTSEQVLEDVSEDHARKTITVEPHPHGGVGGGAAAGGQAASIHPCRHAEVMKRLAERAAAGGAGRALTVEGYLVLFLKFIASVVPTIQYDYTMET